MANITLYQPDDLLNGITQAQTESILNRSFIYSYGNTALTVQLPDNSYINYFGQFQQASGGLAGTITQFDAYNSDGVLAGTAQNLNIDLATTSSVGSYDAFSYILRDSDFINGSYGGDTLGGFTGSDTIWGNGGNDVIFGGSGSFSPIDGDDFLAGGYGADFLYGNGGNDLIVTGQDSMGSDDAVNLAFGGKGSDYIYGSQTSDTLFGGGSGFDPLDQPDVIFAGNGADSIFGNGGGDYLFGMEGSDTIYGGAGDDNINAGQGDDLLFGNEGNDIFWFTYNEGIKLIADPNIGDRIGLVGTGYSSFEQIQPLIQAIDYGAALVIQGTIIGVYGITPAQLTASEFVFVN